MMESIELTVDGRPVTAPGGATLLDAARQAGVEIPVLCYFAHTTANGLCRMCVVEVEGGRGLQALVDSLPDGCGVEGGRDDIAQAELQDSPRRCACCRLAAWWMPRRPRTRSFHQGDASA